MDPVIN